MQALIPAAAGALLDQRGVSAEARDFASAGEDHALKEGAPLPSPAAVFPRFVESAEASAQG